DYYCLILHNNFWVF
nr:immunoglobulin light chain junction region [Macaca mulatta]MOY05150.1 immunoglobulin light chain junction region [Macaca mulatta]MOY06053.1 immunoglobulin light chain junction region [Macaca mulatta]MOY07354.1 immunoglobulin light chain junction region [Macaca mulatta]MOY07784.1 immunoglobulin light chain junction region [Macaca mulatta]